MRRVAAPIAVVFKRERNTQSLPDAEEADQGAGRFQG